MRRARFSELRAAIEKAAGDPAAVRKLLAEDGAAGDNFGGWGKSVSVSGDTAVIGAYGDDDRGENSGSAYVFACAADGTWSQQAKLTAEDGAAGDEFGWSVAVDGDTAVIGARSDGDNGDKSGSAYVFVRAADGTWSQQAKLTAADGAAGDKFGWSVSVSGGTAVIGAWGDDDKGDESGSAYVFVRAADGTWGQQAKLTAADGAANNSFGWSVAVDGDMLVIGSPHDEVGSAYVFMRAADGTWSQHAKLTPVIEFLSFGNTVSVSGDTAVIGSCISAYVFTLAADGTWSQQAMLSFPEEDFFQIYFGLFVSIYRDTAVIGAYQDDDMGDLSGSVYVFVRAADGTWTQQAKLTAPDGAAGDKFGWSVAVSGGTAVIGAYGDDDRGENSGSAYVFVRAADGTWSQQAAV